MTALEDDSSAHGDRVRVLFELDAQSGGDCESLWGEQVSADIVRLDNIPLLVFGVSLGDSVRVVRDSEALRFAEVVRRGGHSTYRVMLEADDTGALGERWLRDLVVLGCGHEGLTPRYFAVDVPADVDIFLVYRLLESGMAAGAWTFEEGHCGHLLPGG